MMTGKMIHKLTPVEIEDESDFPIPAKKATDFLKLSLALFITSAKQNLPNPCNDTVFCCRYFIIDQR